MEQTHSQSLGVDATGKLATFLSYYQTLSKDIQDSLDEYFKAFLRLKTKLTPWQQYQSRLVCDAAHKLTGHPKFDNGHLVTTACTTSHTLKTFFFFFVSRVMPLSVTGNLTQTYIHSIHLL